MKYIGLLDCNNFFVSCERLFRPDLLGKPVVVLSSNDGCVVARSKEVKELGIPMGVPHFKVKDEFKAADVVVFSSNFPLYRDISARVMQALRDEVSDVAQYSVDEAFFTFEAEAEAEVYAFLRQVKRSVEAKVGMPVTVGAAKTKTIAKCASELGKKADGVCFLEGDSWKNAALTFPLEDVWGIGGKTAEKMRAIGLITVADLLAADPALVTNRFGVHGARLAAELSEQPAGGRSHDDLQHSIMSTRSFRDSTTDLSILEDAVAYHVAHAAEELRELKAVAGEIRVLIRTSRHGDWFLRGGSKECILDAPTSDTRVLLREALTLTRNLYEPGVPYKKAGVVLGRISSSEHQSLSLFSQSEQGAVLATVDSLNQKFGKDTLTIGRVGHGERWQASRSHISPHYTTKWNEIATVVA